MHKETTRLAKTKPVIVLEDLDIKEMLRNNRLSRQISDAGWSEFRRLLEYKTKWYGSNIVIAPRYYPSSKMCSECKVCKQELPLQIREWECKRCHTWHDRNINSAKNLLNWYTGSSPEIEACGDTSDGRPKSC